MRGNILFIASALFVVSVIITLNLFFQQNYQAEMAGQFNKQQLLLAETIAQNIEEKIEELKGEAVGLARLLGGRKFDSTLAGFVDSAVAELRGEVREVKIFDPDIRAVYGQTGPGDSQLARRVRDAGEPVILDDVPGRRLRLAVPVARPGKSKRAALIMDIDIGTLNRKFVAAMKSGDKGYAWMMDNTGTLLFHPTQPEMEGKNLYLADESCFECHKSFEVEKRILESEASGVRTYIAPFGEDKIIAFSRVDIAPGSFWIACVSIPYSEVTASIRKSMGLHSILIILIFAATAAGAFTLVIINRKRIKAEERAKHESELKKYTIELEETVNRKTIELIGEKEKLDAIVAAVGVGLFIADEKGKVLWMNRTLRDWFGGSEARDIWLKDIYGGQPVTESALYSEGMREIIYRTLGGKTGYFQITTTPLAGHEGKVQLLGVVHDVTEIKKFEEHMAHSERLASLGRLTAGIAHEIGNPLTSVFSFLQILREMETEDFKKESLDTILFHINRIADIVRQLSGISKLPPAELKKTDINELIESSLSLMQYDKRAKNINIVKELGDVPPAVTDKNQVSQVFVNLILNAVDAMPEGGALTIKSRASEDGGVIVEFADTGYGISKENLQRIFDPFFTTKDKGTGLGLSVSYSIVKRLGGYISVESEEGKGTKFMVHLPGGSKSGG